LLNSDSQEDLDNKVQRLYNEFMEDFIAEEWIIWMKWIHWY
jgi:hypothetical protein